MKSISILVFILLCNHFYAQDAEVSIVRTSVAVTRSTQDVLNFCNHDLLHGKLIKIENSIYWKYPGVKNYIIFPISSIDKITLQTKIASHIAETVVYLTNGDYIPGKIISLDNKILIFDTTFGGTLKIPWIMIKEISHSGAGREIYQGPKGEDEWKSKNRPDGDRKITINDGIMSIPRRFWAICNVNLPDKSRINLDLISPQGQNQIQIFFYTKTGDNGYCISQNGSYFDIERITEDDGSESMDAFELPSILDKGILKISIFTDKNKKRIMLMFNDKLIKDITDDFGEFAGNGKSIAFYNTGRKKVEIKNITVANWSGSTPQAGQRSEGNNATDMLFFINRDKSSGTLQSIKDNILNFKTEFALFKVPLSRVKNLLTASDNQRRARRNKNDVQAFINGGGRITVNLVSLQNKILTGTSENFTKGSFKITSFNKIKFNIYTKKTDQTSSDAGR